MTEARRVAIKKYWNKAKKQNPFNDETIGNGYLEGFIDGATEATKELNKKLSQAEADYDKMFWQKNETISNLQEQNTNLQTMLQAEREVRCNDEYLKKVTELDVQIEKMQNCRNCKNEKIEGACGQFTQVGWCKNWELAE